MGSKQTNHEVITEVVKLIPLSQVRRWIEALDEACPPMVVYRRNDELGMVKEAVEVSQSAIHVVRCQLVDILGDNDGQSTSHKHGTTTSPAR